MPGVNVRRDGVGSPEPTADREHTQVANLCYEGEHTQVENLCYEREHTQVANQYCPVRSRIAATGYDHTPPEKCGRFGKTVCLLVFSQTR